MHIYIMYNIFSSSKGRNNNCNLFQNYTLVHHSIHGLRLASGLHLTLTLIYEAIELYTKAVASQELTPHHPELNTAH